MSLSEILSEYLRSHHMSQRAFAQKSGLSNGYIAMIVKGKNSHTDAPIAPTLASLKCLADGMSMSIDDLLAQMDDEIIVLSDRKKPVNNAKLFTDMFLKLTIDQQDFILAAMQGLVAKNEGGLNE